MIKNSDKIAKIICIAAAVMMLATLVMQFLPFWSANEDTASVAGYVALPKSHTGLNKFFRNLFKSDFGIKFSMKYVYPMPVVVFVSCILGLFLCVKSFGKFLSFVLPTVAGIYGAQGYLLNVVFQYGMNWQLHMVICIVLAVVGITGLAICALPVLMSIVKSITKKQELITE